MKASMSTSNIDSTLPIGLRTRFVNTIVRARRATGIGLIGTWTKSNISSNVVNTVTCIKLWSAKRIREVTTNIAFLQQPLRVPG